MVILLTKHGHRKMPHPIDVMVGKRIRLRRVQLSMSQTDLGKRLSITFQQIQKYENGSNRVSCSRLHEISKVLEVPITYFFDHIPDANLEAAVAEQFELHHLKDGVRLISAFIQIQNHNIRRNIIFLIEAIAASNDDET